jgi:hypothetical protein
MGVLTLIVARFGGGKAVEGYRTPRRFARVRGGGSFLDEFERQALQLAARPEQKSPVLTILRTDPFVLIALLAASITAHARPIEVPTDGTKPAEPVFVTSDKNGGWSIGGYYVHNNMWNSTQYSPCTETLSAWSWDHWQVVARMNNKTGDGAVKTYPNVHKDFGNVPIGSFSSVKSTFAETSPHVGIYNVAYDIWINGIATPGCTEIMIWNENFNQVPGGSPVQEVTFGGRTYKVYKRANSGYIAFVPSDNFTSGTLDLLEIMKWTISKGWLPPKSTLNQICFGVEIVSTDDADATFQVTAFSIEASLRPKDDLTAPGDGPANKAAPPNRDGKILKENK